MDSILDLLSDEHTWEEFLSYRLMKGRFNWYEFDRADTYVAQQQYLPVASRLQRGEPLSVPTRHLVNKMGSGRKRVVYSFPDDEQTVLKVMAYLLYRYDAQLTPNCYSFRRGLTAHDAIRQLLQATGQQPMWAFKLDIHDYFNSIDIGLLLPILSSVLSDDARLYAFFEQMLTDGRSLTDGHVVNEQRGIMAGTPTSPFLANVYLSEVDRHFAQCGAIYARYSDDIILFAPTRQQLDGYRATLEQFLRKYHLEANPDKVRIYSPDEAFDFLGFKCHADSIDIADATLRKMKDKIRRKAHALQRWRSRNGVEGEKAMKALISQFNKKFFESDDSSTLSWARWFFPVINRVEGLKQIDHYMQQNLRFVATGRHNKANYRISYAQLKQLGYRSLVAEFFRQDRCSSQGGAA
ncbi:MAG: hypothetical protein II792_06400 [Prevotella sp.]|nr:hypothetical protein [Prevotella sp.]